MKPTVRIAATATPDGGEIVLYKHDGDFIIEVNGHDLMLSRQHESELELARLGCAHLAGRPEARILIGGLGMGYTLRQALDTLGPDANVLVAELLPAIVDWNRDHLGVLNGQPLEDPRVAVASADIVELIGRSPNTFDAILLDVDNGPSAIVDTGNRRLYGRRGIGACRAALRDRGVLAIWSAKPSKAFEHTLMACGLQVRRFRVHAYANSKSQWRYVWVAATDAKLLPAGGGEPRPPAEPGGARRPQRRGTLRNRQKPSR